MARNDECIYRVIYYDRGDWYTHYNYPLNWADAEAIAAALDKEGWTKIKIVKV